MKLLRLAAWTLWFMLSWIALAHAGPIGAALGALGSFLASGTVLANLALSAILTGVKIGISLLTKAQQDNQPAGVQADVKFGGDNPLSFIMGRFATPGQLEYANTWGKVRDVDNAYITHVISLGDLPMNLTGLWFDDEKVTVPDMSGPPQMPQGWDIPEIESVNGNTYCWIRFRDGTQTAAEQFLIDQFGGDPERPWLADMIGRGVPLLIATTRYNPEVVPGIPQYLMETDGIPLYDPRKDSTVGGSGAQRWNDPSTWEPSSNNIVHVYNILRGIYYDGEWLWGGQCQAWQLPLANWMAAMNACDQAVPLAGGGTEPQFRNGCEITLDQEPAAVIENILKGCNGRIAEIGGIYKVTVGAPGAAVYSFTDETIVVTEGQALDPFPGLESTYNGAQASYPEPAEKWGAKDAPAYLRPDLEVLDDGRRLVTGLQFPYTPYAVQIQRLLQAAVQDARRFRVHTLVLPPEAWLLEPNDVVSWTSARNGYIEKKFIVVEIEGDSNFLQYVTLKEVDPADYSWNPATDEQPYSVGPIGPIKPAPQAMTGWNAFPATIGEDGNQLPSIRVTFAGQMVGIQMVRVQVRRPGESTIEFEGYAPYGDPDTNADPASVVLQTVFPRNTDFEVRGIFVPIAGSGLTFEWSGWIPVKTRNVWVSGTTYLKDLGEDVYARLEEIRQEFDDVRARVEQLALQASEGIGDNIDQKSVSKRFRDATAIAFSETRASIETKAQVFRQPNPPTANADGDIWIDTDDDNFVRVWNATTNQWEDAGAKGLQTFAQDEPPVAENLGDLWMDTNDGNRLYRWDGQEWVEVADERIVALASDMTAVQATVGNISGSGLWKMEVQAGTGDVVARAVIMMRATIADDWVEVGTIWEAGFEGGDPTKPFARQTNIADQFIFTDGANDFLPIVIENGEIKLAIANIGTVNAGIVQSSDGKMVINLNSGTIIGSD